MSLRIHGARLQIGKAAKILELLVPELNLDSGTCTALTGRSGSGKTSVLELAALMRAPANVGEFRIDDRDVRQLSLTGSFDARAALRAKYISYTVQSGGVLPFLNGEENALAGVRVLGRPVNASIRKRLLSMAHVLNAEDLLSKHRSELSGGERYRIGLIRSLLVPKPLVLADEPTAALDDSLASVALQLLRELADLHKSTVLIATHDVKLAQDTGFTIRRM